MDLADTSGCQSERDSCTHIFPKIKRFEVDSLVLDMVNHVIILVQNIYREG